MKTQELRKLIREEVKKLVNEANTNIDSAFLNKFKMALKARMRNPEDENAHDAVEAVLTAIFKKAGVTDAKEMASSAMEDEVFMSGPYDAAVSTIKDMISDSMNESRVATKKTLTEAMNSYEFDLTNITGENFKQVLNKLGIDWNTGKVEKTLPGTDASDLSKGSPMWTWKSPTLTVMTGNNPITGKYAVAGRRSDEKDYASYIVLKGEPADVSKAKMLIKKAADSIKEQISEAAIPGKVMDMLQPVLDAIADGTINKRYHNDVMSAIKDAMVKTTPGAGKFRITNFQNVVAKVSTQNDSGTVFLSTKDNSLSPVTVKRTRDRKQYFVNPKTNQSLGYTSLSQLASDYADGMFS